MISLRIKALKDDARILGLVLPAGFECAIDVRKDQAAAVQAAADAGECEIMLGGDALKAALPAPEPKVAKK